MNAKLYALSKRHALADGAIQPGQLSVGFAAYFDLAGHGWWRSLQGLNLPATSSRRAARNSAMTPGFPAAWSVKVCLFVPWVRFVGNPG